jgi:hypothetical protein
LTLLGTASGLTMAGVVEILHIAGALQASAAGDVPDLLDPTEGRFVIQLRNLRW